MNKPFHPADRLRSFNYAFNGIGIMLRSQHNAWIHALATLLVIGAGLFFQVTTAEWLWLVPVIMAVWMAEAFNTALECLADAAKPDYHPLVGKAKDVAAGAVLITAIGAAIIGLIIFYPHIASLFK